MKKEIDIEVTGFEYTDNVIDYSGIITLKVSFFDRLKFLFKGSKARFHISMDLMREVQR